MINNMIRSPVLSTLFEIYLNNFGGCGNNLPKYQKNIIYGYVAYFQFYYSFIWLIL